MLLNVRSLEFAKDTDHLRKALHIKCDRIVVGEMRDGAAALETLKGWNTGHPGGLSTLHANSATDALRRIEDLTAEVMAEPPRRTIGQAVDIVVHMARTAEGRRVEQVLSVNGVLGDGYRLEAIA